MLDFGNLRYRVSEPYLLTCIWPCAKLNKIRDIRPSWLVQKHYFYIKERMVAMVFHGIITPLQISLIKQTFPFMILNLFVGKIMRNQNQNKHRKKY